jgi:catechol 2,3-dioxygenase-like lactoylglutathione lyase family enzyme
VPALVQPATVVIDCADPGPLAEFYRTLTGWEVTYTDPDCVYLGDGGAIQLGFQRVEGYQPPAWPGGAKQAHLDFKATDVEQAVKAMVELGASRPEFQPGGDEWTVLADPEGHLFCVASAG